MFEIVQLFVWRRIALSIVYQGRIKGANRVGDYKLEGSDERM